MTATICGSYWTAERCDRLSAYVAAKMSCTQIAEAFGDTTRNAVISRMGRMGLISQYPNPRGGFHRRFHRTPAERKAQGNKAGGIVEAIKAKQRTRSEVRAGNQKRPFGADASLAHRVKAKASGQVSDIEPRQIDLSLAGFNAAIPAGQRVTLFQLTDQTCRFPLWADDSADRFYCGAAEADMSEGRPYCPDHSAVAGAGHSRDRTTGFQTSVHKFR
jgi:GcrA cell cycle regulator